MNYYKSIEFTQADMPMDAMKRAMDQIWAYSVIFHYEAGVRGSGTLNQIG